MSHRTWISLIDWFIDRLISWLIARFIDCFISCLLDCPPDWLTEIGGAIGRDDESDEIDHFSTRDSSDDSIASSSDDTSKCSEFSVMRMCFELPMIEECSEFSMMRNDCLSTDWFSDYSSDCSSDRSSDWLFDCSSSWLCGNERDDMSDEMNDRLYDEMKDNRLYNCLLNADENSDDWKNFGNRNEIDCRSDNWFSNENDETERDEIDDEILRSKFVFRRILMMMKMKFS